MRLDLFFKLNYQYSTIILSVRFKYYVCDLYFDVSQYSFRHLTRKLAKCVTYEK